MFGNMGDMSKMLEGMQENAAKLKAELESKTFSVKTGGGMVELSVNGAGEVIDLNIDDSITPLLEFPIMNIACFIKLK